jgi:hypothetical protein
VIRRICSVFAAVALAGTIASGCSTFTSNRDAASVNGHHLSVKQYEALLTGLAIAPDAFGIAAVGPEGLPGKTARSILGQWVSNMIMSDTLTKKGVTISAADRKALEDKITGGNAAGVWATLGPSMQTFVIDAQALQPAFQTAFGNDAAKVFSDATTAAAVTIDSRYGMWDAATGQVVATR